MKSGKGLYFILFLVACYFVLFLHLDSQAVHLWDESRRAVSAFEMVQNGHWLVPHFEGQPEMYGTKPPLLVWLQAFFMMLVGYNELAVRLPSALAALATVLLLVAFAERQLKLPLAGYFGSFVLLTNLMYINYHGAVTGDYDALLTLFTTAYLLSYYRYLENLKPRHIYLTGLFIALACLTKSIAGLFFAPGLLLFTLYRRKLQDVLRQRSLYLAAAGTIAVIAVYYLARESVNPGYLDAVWMNEVYGRYFEPQEGHQHDFWYYFRHTFEQKRFHPWVYFLPLGFLISLSLNRTQRLGQLILINAVIFLLILSKGGTKLEWYPLPVLPSLSLVIGIGLAHLHESVTQKLRPKLRPWLFATFLIAIFAQPYWQTVQRNLNNTPRGWEEWRERYRDAMRQLPDEKSYTIVHGQYNGHIVFYKKLWNHQGYDIRQHMLQPPAPHVQENGFTTGPPVFRQGEKVLVCEGEAQQAVEKNNQTNIIREAGKCRLLQIN